MSHVDPLQASSTWVVTTTLLTRLVAAAGAAPSPLVQRLQAVASAASTLRVEEWGTPPSMDSAAVRQHLKGCLPPVLSKVSHEG